MAKAQKGKTTSDSGAVWLSDKVIRERVGDRGFELGLEYFESGNVFDGRRQGASIRARCHGQSANSYILSAEVTDGRILSAHCGCPVGEDGSCKHVAALLLALAHNPELFSESAPVDKLLAGCSREKLIELIGKMIDQQPDLQSWLELAVQTVAPSKDGVKSTTYRNKAIHILENRSYEWGAEQEVAQNLEKLTEFGDTFLKQKQYDNAAAVYCGILDGIIQGYESDNDREGDISTVMVDCSVELGKCLDHLAAGSAIRHSALKALLELVRLDSYSGGLGFADEAGELLSRNTTSEDRTWLAQTIRDEILPSVKADDDWERSTWGSWLLEFEGSSYDDEAFLKHCRDFGLTSAAVERMLERGRLDDALNLIRAAKSNYEVVGYANQLVKHKHAEIAYGLVQERFKLQSHENNHQLESWLKTYYEQRQDWQSILNIEVSNFDKRPSLSGYQAIRKQATKLNSWDSLRPKLLAQIPKDSEDLIRLHLDEGNVATAITLLESRPKRPIGTYAFYGQLPIEVAKAAEKSHPEEAIKIYRIEAESLIESRGRHSYVSACGHLKKIKDLYQAMGRAKDWETYIKALREKNRALRALSEELSRAGL